MRDMDGMVGVERVGVEEEARINILNITTKHPASHPRPKKKGNEDGDDTEIQQKNGEGA